MFRLKQAEVAMKYIIAVFCLIFAVTSTDWAVGADARKGETLAKRWCASCHVISADQQQGTAQAPPFSVVANKADFNETTIAYFLLAPHPRMPDMNLSRSEAADLAAYIRTQR
jgi:mono/diheme cytochrome c family protein